MSTERSLAVERTALAWQRTGLTHMAAGAALLRLLPPSPARPVLSAVLVAIGGAVSVGGRRLQPGAPHRRWLGSLAVSTAIVAATALALSF